VFSGKEKAGIEDFMEITHDSRKAFKISAIVSAAMMASLLVYLIFVEFIKAKYDPFLGLVRIQDRLLLRYLFYALSVAVILILRILRGILLKISPKDTALDLIQKLQKTSILTTALCEGPALFGLTLFFLGGFSRDFYLLSFVSLVLLFMYFPRYKNWQDWLKISQKGSSCCL